MKLSYADIYDAAFGTLNQNYKYNIEKIAESVDNPTIVEFGSGAGSILDLSISCDLVLVENNPAMVQKIKYRSGKEPSLTIIEQSATQTGLPANHADFVVLSPNTLSEMPIAFVLFEAHRILKPGGKILFSNQNPEFKHIVEPSERSLSLSGCACYLQLETYPFPALGRYSYQSQISITDGKSDFKHHVEQCFLPHHLMGHILKTIGFENIQLFNRKISEPFDPNSSFLLGFVASKAPISRENAHSRSKLSSFYDSVAPKYEEFMTTANYSAPTHISANMSHWEGKIPKVLDLGCGNGWLADAFEMNGIRKIIYGIDHSTGMIEECSRKGKYNGLLAWDLNDAFPIFAERSFNIVSCIGTTEFIENLDSVLSSIRNCLIISGELWITFESNGASSGISITPLNVLETSKKSYSRLAVLQMLEKLKFKILEMKDEMGYISPSLKTEIPFIFVRACRSS